MPKMPVLKPRELVHILEKLGFVRFRQRGSHLIMVHLERNKQVTVPMHSKPLKKGTLAAILRQAAIGGRELMR